MSKWTAKNQKFSFGCSFQCNYCYLLTYYCTRHSSVYSSDLRCFSVSQHPGSRKRNSLYINLYSFRGSRITCFLGFSGWFRCTFQCNRRLHYRFYFCRINFPPYFPAITQKSRKNCTFGGILFRTSHLLYIRNHMVYYNFYSKR